MPEAINLAQNISWRVYCEDTNTGSIGNYNNYLRFAQRGPIEYLLLLDTYIRLLMQDIGLDFEVKGRAEKYVGPIIFDDPLKVYNGFSEVWGASVLGNQIVNCQVAQLVCLKVRFAYVGTVSRPKRILLALLDNFAVDKKNTKF